MDISVFILSTCLRNYIFSLDHPGDEMNCILDVILDCFKKPALSFNTCRNKNRKF